MGRTNEALWERAKSEAKSKMGGQTPWGIVVNYECEAAGEDA